MSKNNKIPKTLPYINMLIGLANEGVMTYGDIFDLQEKYKDASDKKKVKILENLLSDLAKAQKKEELKAAHKRLTEITPGAIAGDFAGVAGEMFDVADEMLDTFLPWRW